jgi:hypothetical protein
MKLVVVLAMACGFIAAPTVAAGYASAAPCDGAACVPYVAHDVAYGGSCAPRTRYVFGLDPTSTHTFTCSSRQQWVPSKPLIGVRDLGAPCSGSDSSAQSPDGIPLACNGQGWAEDYGDIFNSKTVY